MLTKPGFFFILFIYLFFLFLKIFFCLGSNKSFVQARRHEFSLIRTIPNLWDTSYLHVIYMRICENVYLITIKCLLKELLNEIPSIICTNMVVKVTLSVFVRYYVHV